MFVEPPAQHDPSAAGPDRHPDRRPTATLQLSRRRQHAHLRALHVALPLPIAGRAPPVIHNLTPPQRHTASLPLALQHQPPVVLRRPLEGPQPWRLARLATVPRRAARRPRDAAKPRDRQGRERLLPGRDAEPDAREPDAEAAH